MPLNFLVLGALAVLVLVVVGGAFMSGGTSIFGGIAQFFTTTASSSQDQIVGVCDSSCSGLDYSINSLADVVSKPLCTKRFNFQYDADQSGKIDSNENYKINCFGKYDGNDDGVLESAIPAWPFTTCNVHLKSGSTAPITSAACVVA